MASEEGRASEQGWALLVSPGKLGKLLISSPNPLLLLPKINLVTSAQTHQTHIGVQIESHGGEVSLGREGGREEK